MKVLLTGYQGFVGNALYNDYLTHSFWNDRIHCIEKDDALPNVDFDVVIACGAVSDNQYKDPDILKYNVLSMIELLAKYPCAYFVYFSSQTARHPQTLYGHTKRCAEEILKASMNRACIFQPFNIYGDGEHRKPVHCRSLPYRLASHELEVLWDTERDYIHVADVVEAVEHTIKHRFIGTYHLGTGKATEAIVLSESVDYDGYRCEPRPDHIERGHIADPRKMLPDWQPKKDVLKEVQHLEWQLSPWAFEYSYTEHRL